MFYYLVILHSYHLYPINTKAWLTGFSVVQLKEVVRTKDPALSSALLKIREGIVDEEVASLLKNRLRSVNVASVDLTRSHYLFKACRSRCNKY